MSYADYISSPRPVANSISKDFDPSHLYALPSKSAVRSTPTTSLQKPAEASTSSAFLHNRNNNLPKISCLGEKFKNSAHSSSQESNNSHSDHSGATLPLDEPIEYADA